MYFKYQKQKYKEAKLEVKYKYLKTLRKRSTTTDSCSTFLDCQFYEANKRLGTWRHLLNNVAARQIFCHVQPDAVWTQGTYL